LNHHKDVLFNKCNAPNGWLSLHGPYGFSFNNENWQSMAQAWYSIIHNVQSDQFSLGRYKTAETELPDAIRYGYLIGILNAIITTHPILKDYLLDTGQSRLIYSISKYSSHDQKWLGYNLEDEIGQNKLGMAWMEIRKKLQEEKL